LPLAAVIADHGFNVVGVDLDKERCKQINNGLNPIPEEPELGELIQKHGGKNLVATSAYEDANNCTFYIVIVPLFLDKNHNPDFQYLEDACRNIGKILKRGDCVVLETTVPPKTTETLVRKWLEEESGMRLGDFYLAHSPERIMTGYSVSRLREFPKIVGGVNNESGEKVFGVYKKFIPNLSLASSARITEFIKVIEGCYRSTNIALANELFKIANELDVDFFEAREYANHQYCTIHLPSTGVGGHCIPVYPWFLIKDMEDKGKPEHSVFLRMMQQLNDEMAEYWVERIVLECMHIGKPLDEVKICVKGITFREDSKSVFNSRNLAVARLLEERGLDVYVYDDLFTEDEIKQMNLKFACPNDVDIIFDSFKLKIIQKIDLQIKEQYR